MSAPGLLVKLNSLPPVQFKEWVAAGEGLAPGLLVKLFSLPPVQFKEWVAAGEESAPGLLQVAGFLLLLGLGFHSFPLPGTCNVLK
jgi:hypothetical protein